MRAKEESPMHEEGFRGHLVSYALFDDIPRGEARADKKGASMVTSPTPLPPMILLGYLPG
jgi:hypothetical protein